MEGRLIAKRYKIIERIGGGGMAVVYKAMDQVIDRYVAIKILHDVLHHDEGIHRFIREAKNAGRLSHPNIVSVHDAGREGETYFIVMECMEDNSLKDWIQKQGPLSPEESITIAMQICDGLTHAHENGIIHRDIKPHNILRNSNGQFKITDFGISFFSNATQITQTGMVMGSVHYFSPEQASGTKVDFPSDLYSLGIILYEMVTGQVPFDADSFLSIVLKHVQAPIPNPQKINPEVPNELCRIIFKAMDKEPNNRFQSANEMKQALQKVLEQKDHNESPFLEQSLQQADHLDLSGQSNHKKESRKRRRLTVFTLVILIFFIIFFLVNNNTSTVMKRTSHQNIFVPTPPRSSENELTNPSQKRSQLEGTYRWWRELPKSTQNDHVFRNFRSKGTNGEYDVQLEVGNIPSSQFYYDIYVVDNFSSRLILNGKYVPYRNTPEKKYALHQFHVSIPVSLLPAKGIAKIEIYWLKGNNKKEMNEVEFLLQQWGHPSES